AAVRLIWVTGVSGAGKSAVSRRLAALGYDAVSTDSAPGLCRWVDDGGRPVERPDGPDLAWLATHHWAWDRPDSISSSPPRASAVPGCCSCAATPPTHSTWRSGST